MAPVGGHIVPVNQITTKAPDGRVGTQYRALQADDGHFLTHPDDTQNASVKTASLDSLFNHLGSLQTFYNAINVPGVREKAQAHYLSGGEEGDQELIQAMHALGTDPVNYVPKKKVTLAGDRVLVEDERGNFTVTPLAPTALEAGKLQLESAQAERQLAIADKGVAAGKMQQELNEIDHYAETHLNPDGSTMTPGQAAGELQSLGVLKSPPAGGVGGGRQNVYTARVLNSVREGIADAGNLAEMPVSVSTGILGLGGVHEGGLLTAGVNLLKQKVQPQDDALYKVMSDGLAKAAATLESSGLASGQGLVNQVKADLTFQPGETYLTRLAKFAQTRQTFEQGIEASKAAAGVTPQQLAQFNELQAQIARSIPFTQKDVIRLYKSKNPGDSITTYSTKAGASIPQENPPPAFAPVVSPPAAPAPEIPVAALDAAATRASRETGHPPINGRGWHLLGDGRGGYAYVSPDGKSYEDVSAGGDANAFEGALRGSR